MTVLGQSILISFDNYLFIFIFITTILSFKIHFFFPCNHSYYINSSRNSNLFTFFTRETLLIFLFLFYEGSHSKCSTYQFGQSFDTAWLNGGRRGDSSGAKMDDAKCPIVGSLKRIVKKCV